MDPEDAISLLLQYAYEEQDHQDVQRRYRGHAKSIASELGYLALALKQAAYTIRRQMRPLEYYLQSLLHCRKELLKYPIIASAADANIAATWELPFTEISSRVTSPSYRDAADLIHIFAFLHFDRIPCSLFHKCVDSFKVSSIILPIYPLFLLESVTSDEVHARTLAGARVLYEHSIISFYSEEAKAANDLMPPTLYINLHPAVHEWARARLNKSDQAAWLSCTAAVLEHAISKHMEASGREFRRLLLPHIDFCRILLRELYPNLPETDQQAAQLETFGLVYSEAGNWETARALQRKVMDYRLKRFKRSDPLTIHAQRNLASSYWNLFQIEDCLSTLNTIRLTQLIYRPTVLDYFVWPLLKPDYLDYYITLDDLTRSLWLAGNRQLSLQTGTRALNGCISSWGLTTQRR